MTSLRNCEDVVTWLQNRGYAEAAEELQAKLNADLDAELMDILEPWGFPCLATYVDVTDCIRRRIKLLEGELKALRPCKYNTEEWWNRVQLIGRILREDTALALFADKASSLLRVCDCWLNGERF
jgi:hypothetical protein